MVFCAKLKIERKPGDAALMSMTQNVAARLDVKSKRSMVVLLYISVLGQ